MTFQNWKILFLLITDMKINVNEIIIFQIILQETFLSDVKVICINKSSNT